MRRSLLPALLVAVMGVAGCAAESGYAVSYSTGPYGADLAYAAPGVQVLVGSDYPIFYADNVYWRYYSGRWYRSPTYRGGWVYARPPYAVRQIRNPWAYTHYHGPGRTYVGERGRYDHHRNPPRTYRSPPPANRPPPRSYQAPAPPRHGAPPPPPRDHRY